MRLSVDINDTVLDDEDREWELTITVGPYNPGSWEEAPDQEIILVSASCAELDIELTRGDVQTRLEAYGVSRKDIDNALSEAPEKIWE